MLDPTSWAAGADRGSTGTGARTIPCSLTENKIDPTFRRGAHRSRSTRRKIGWNGALLLAGMTLCGCSGGGSGGGGGETSTLGGGGDFGDDIVAKVELAAPEENEFFLRATLPVPPGFFHPEQAIVPLSLTNFDRRVMPTQIETVSRYADEADGADVVELIARVERPPGSPPGERMSFFVAHNPHPSGEIETTESVAAFMNTPGAIRLTTRDLFGHKYSSDLLEDVREDDGRAVVLKDGLLTRQRKTHSILEPVETVPGAQGTYPRMMGVHAVVTEWTGEDVISLDLNVHNGLSGLDKSDPLDDALHEIYFDQLDLRIPRGWVVMQAFDNPLFGDPELKSGWRTYPVVEALQNGKTHMMPRQSHFWRRFVIYKERNDATERKAREILEERGLAFCTTGRAPAGQSYWSWWNRETARFLATNRRLPSIDHVGLHEIRQDFAADLQHYASHVAAGTVPGYPVISEALGWAHPWGVKYGGMTGGEEIFLYDGIELAASGSNDGYRLAQLIARMYVDRQRTSLYNKDGRPAAVRDWVQDAESSDSYVPFEYFLLPNLSSNEPFGFEEAPTFHHDSAVSQGKVPGYASELKAFKPIDLQHYVRYTRNLKVLAWLGNDALSKNELAMSSEAFRLSYHEHYNSPNGHAQGSSLRSALDYVGEHPGWGVGFGRGEGWGLDTAVAAYAVGDDDLRERYYDWFTKIADLVEQGQSTCTGVIMAQPQLGKAGGQYRVMQSFETAITQNALWAMNQTAFRGRSAQRANRLDDVLERSMYAQISPLVWRDGSHGPANWIAMGAFNKQEPPFCGPPPPDGDTEGSDHYQLWSSFAYAFELTGDPQFLDRAAEAAGTTNLYNWLHQGDLDNLANKAALLALVQELAGEG